MKLKTIPLFKVFMSHEVDKPLLDVLHSGYIGQGTKVEEFEKEISKIIGNENILTVNSGTSALHLALHMANVEGKYVITTPLTCSATNWPILANRAKILWADVDPNTGNISTESIKQLVNKFKDGIGAIIAVHWGGYPCDMDEIHKIAEQNTNKKIPVIEDAAHAFGAVYKDRLVGNHSEYTAFSFQAIKHITTVDGGLLILKNKELYNRAKLLRWYGIDRENTSLRKDLRCEEDIKEYGFKFHMNDINAVIGLANIKYFEQIISKHTDNAEYYKNELKSINNITLLNESNDRKSSYWLFTMKVKERNKFMEYMSVNGVMTSKVHARNDKNTCVINSERIDLSNLDNFEKEMVCIPVGYHVGKEDREYIVNLIKKGWI